MFEGHHRVGWNSYPNTMALLTGEAAYKPDVEPDSGVFYIDEEFQFIQNTFKENGYLRLHLEDFSNWPNFFRPGLLTCYLLSLSDEIIDVIFFRLFPVQRYSGRVLLQICLPRHEKRTSIKFSNRGGFLLLSPGKNGPQTSIQSSQGLH